MHLSWRWRCQFLLRWPRRRRGDQTPTGRVVGLPLWNKERPPSPSRSQDARPCLGADGIAFPQVRAGERSRRLLSSLQPQPFFKAGVPDGDLILNVQKRPRI